MNPIRNVSLTLHSRIQLLVLIFHILFSSKKSLERSLAKNDIRECGIDPSTESLIGISKYAKVHRSRK